MPAPMASPTPQPARKVERMSSSDIGPSWRATKKPSPKPTSAECIGRLWQTRAAGARAGRRARRPSPVASGRPRALPAPRPRALLELQLALRAGQALGQLPRPLALGVELRAEQDRHVRDPQPDEEDDHPAERPV